jgi:hypothetical protein
MIINENSKFYGIAYSKEKNTMHRIPLQSEDRHLATQEAIEYCIRTDMRFDNVYPVRQNARQGNCLTKFAKYRKRYGKNPPEFNNVL